VLSVIQKTKKGKAFSPHFTRLLTNCRFRSCTFCVSVFVWFNQSLTIVDHVSEHTKNFSVFLYHSCTVLDYKN